MTIRSSRLALPLACLLLAGAGAAHAQALPDCPALPADGGLEWDRLDGPGFTFCKAIRTTDGSQAFAVMLGSESPFKPVRSKRAEEGVIDGRAVRWYSGEIAANPGAIVRETLVELDRNQVAHVTLRASSEEQKDAALRQVQALRFPQLLTRK